MAGSGNRVIVAAEARKRALDGGSIVKPKKEIGRERDGYAEKGLGGKGVYGPRKPGLERPTSKVRPKTLERAVKNISTYNRKLEQLSMPALKKELQKVREKIADLKKKLEKAKKSKKPVFEKQIGPLLLTEKLIVEILRGRMSAVERKIDEFKSTLNDFREEYSRASMEREPEALRGLINRIDILLKTRVREIPTDIVVKLQALRDRTVEKQRVLVEEARRIKLGAVKEEKPPVRREELKVVVKKPAEVRREVSNLPAIRGQERFELERQMAKEPIERLLARFYAGTKDPEKNAVALERLSLIIMDSAKKQYLDLSENKRLPDVEKRQALLVFKEQINNFLSETTRRLQLMNKVKMLDVRYIKNLYNSLKPYLEKVDLDVKILTPKKSLEGQRLEMAEVYRARDPFRDWPEADKTRALVLRDKLALVVSDTHGENNVARVLEDADRAIVKLGPKGGMSYLLDLVRKTEALKVKLLPPGKERKALPPPGPEAKAEQAAREAEAEMERTKKSGRGERIGIDTSDLIRRIERVRTEVKGNREVLAKMIDLQKALMELTRSKAGDIEKGLAGVKNALEGLNDRVDALDRNLSKTLIDGIGTISDQMNVFLERFTEELEHGRKLTDEHLQEIRKISLDLRDIIKDGLQNIDKMPALMDEISGSMKLLRSESRERHEEVMAQIKISREDMEEVRKDLTDSMNTIFDARLFEINKSIRNLDENTTKLLQRLGVLDGTFLSMEHFDKTLLGYMEELREGASIHHDMIVDEIRTEAKKLLDKIGESDPEFAKKLMAKMEDLEALTVEQKDTILEVLDGLHGATTERLERIEDAIDNSKKEILDELSKIAKGTETDAEIKKLVEDVITTIKENNDDLASVLEGVVEKLESIDKKLDANNAVIADILRKVIQEELNERLTRMEGKLDNLVSEGAKKSDTNAIQEQIEELKAMIAHLAQGGGMPPQRPPPGPGGYGPGGQGPGGWNQNQNFNWGQGGRPGEGEAGGGGGGARPPREPEREPGEGEKKKDDGGSGKTEPDKTKPKEEGKPGAFSKAAGWGFGLGIPIALLLVLVLALSKIFGGGTSTTVSTVKTATVPLMPVTGSAASSSSFLPSGFMTPLIIILILVALFLLFPKGK